jgi:uncharacterized DUF497 family protein
MRIAEVIWLDAIVGKLSSKHGVDIDEVEQVFLNSARYRRIEKGKRIGEDVYMALGQTNGGRYLSVLFILKTNKDALILSARDMAARERKLYDKK